MYTHKYLNEVICQLSENEFTRLFLAFSERKNLITRCKFTLLSI